MHILLQSLVRNLWVQVLDFPKTFGDIFPAESVVSYYSCELIEIIPWPYCPATKIDSGAPA
jgi:hypothetical protein